LKRDLDLCRRILLAIEKRPTTGGFEAVTFEGVDYQEVSSQVKLLHESGLITAEDLCHGPNLDWRPYDLTPSGHDFLNAAREPVAWEKAKNLAMKTAGNLSFEAMKLALHQLLP
jgi:Hypothetical protein (DUF2513)